MSLKLPEVLLGLEIHITVNSQKKIFNWENTYQGDISPNSQVGSWELGYLGVLPIINPEVIYLGLKLAVALGMKISSEIIFDRKIYNYFDLPKGYQITQQNSPLATSGHLPVIKESSIEKVPIKTIHLEEDTAKSIYSSQGIKLDFNRAGNPLIELVTEPVFRKVESVVIFIKQLQNLLRYLNISEAKMEKGQLRTDLNFSLQLGKNYKSPRYEIKNLNSLANIEKALQHEIKKHQQLFSHGQKPPISQTFGFDEAKQITVAHREKTSYFYLPEVNIPPIKLKKSEIQKIKKSLPRLPWIYYQEVDNKTADLITKNPALLKIFNFLQKKKKWESRESKNWGTFYLNYLPPDNNIEWFKKKWKSYYQLFQAWKEKKLENKEVAAVIQSLLNTKKNFASLVKKYEKKETVDNYQVEKELGTLWNEELEKMLAINRQKVQNYLLGQLRKKFPAWPPQKIIMIINGFLEKERFPTE